MKLYAFTFSPNSRKLVALIKHYDLEIEVHQINFKDHEQQSEAFLAINPMGKVPALVDGEFSLWEGNAIIMYLCECFPDLAVSPKTAQVRADVNRWLHWQSSHYGPAIGAHMKGGSDQNKREIQPLLEVLEAQLRGREYICGDLSPADFAIGAYSISRAGDNVDWSGHPNVEAWRKRIKSLKGFELTAPPPMPV